MYLIFDTETTGLPTDYSAPVSAVDIWPRMVQVAWQLHAADGSLIEAKNHIIYPEDYTIPFTAAKVHGITTKRAKAEGIPLEDVLEDFNRVMASCTFVIGHNIEFDLKIAGAEYYRKKIETKLLEIKSICTKETTPNFTKLPGGRGNQFKWPTLSELHFKLFGKYFDEAHNAAADVEATARVFFGIVKERVLDKVEFKIPEETYKALDENSDAILAVKVDIGKTREEVDDKATAKKASEIITQAKEIVADIQTAFVHLHCHSQFSVLQSTISIPQLIEKTVEHKMPAVALTDLGNMFGAFEFVQAAINAGIKPIVGCEFFVTEDRNIRKFTKERRDVRHQQVLLAKNKAGYHNLAKISSIGFIEGHYDGLPRVDKETISKYKGDLIALSGNLYAEIPALILNVGETQAEEAFVWWHQLFGDDFYVELQRHGLEEEMHVNEIMLGFAQKYGVKVLATNNPFYANKSDAGAQDILLCVKDGELISTPKGRGRGFRYGLPNDEYYFKSQDEMKALFHDIPEAISNISELVAKCETYVLQRSVLLPKFDIPQEFKNKEDELDGGNRGENAYLRHITYEGAKNRYGEITDLIRERLDFELETIEKTGYPGYFLIVQDFTGAARKMGVSVGPGRGSAAGSAVAYCVGITNIDPIKYDLLFERFLNPERVSLPDIDIDFDDEGRQSVIDYVIKKYGSNQVAQIITYGKMAAKSAIRDTGRVLGLLPAEYDRLSKLVPDKIKLNRLFTTKIEDLKGILGKDEEVKKATDLLDIAKKNDRDGHAVNQSLKVEGSLRNTGIHACGVIITPSDITDFVPVAVAKDSDMWCTQFDNAVVESAGLLKMDFLGLKTLTLIKDAVRIVEERHGIKLNPDEFPLDDELTYQLFQKGETVGVFQYESEGMQAHLKSLKPTVFNDLIAMNALFRPGPMEYIPSFVRRKHGKEPITYDLEGMDEFLQETYGITVYQEQVMLLSQKLADFTKGEADTLRKAMGKKKFDLIEKMKPKFLENGAAKGHNKEKLEKVWKDWEAFASYAFNKSHSTCYAWVAYQTAYLKAHYPAEYMASVLSNNMSNIAEVTKFMNECRRMKLSVLGPDVNESVSKFTVNKKGEIRFGLNAVKGVGAAAVENIIEEREANGEFTSLFDLTKRVNLRAVNKKTLESLAIAGGLDAYVKTRSSYFQETNEGANYLELALKYGSNYQQMKNSAQVSLFGEESDVEMPEPEIPEATAWPGLFRLKKEKELVGVFISGHPLDEYALEVRTFCNCELAKLQQREELLERELSVAGIVTEVFKRDASNGGKPSGKITIEDYSGAFDFWFSGDDFAKFQHYFVIDWFVYIKGRFKKGYNNRIDFKVASMTLLSDLREKMVNKLSILLPIEIVDDNLVDNLESLFRKNKGKCSVSLTLVDKSLQKPNSVELYSKTLKVDLSNEVIASLNTINGIQYKLN